MKNELNTPQGRVVFIRAPKRLTPQQSGMALQSMPDDDPRWLAVHQMIDEALATAVLESSNPKATDSEIRHAGGAVDALSTLKERLLTTRKTHGAAKPEKR